MKRIKGGSAAIRLKDKLDFRINYMGFRLLVKRRIR